MVFQGVNFFLIGARLLQCLVPSPVRNYFVLLFPFLTWHTKPDETKRSPISIFFRLRETFFRKLFSVSKGFQVNIFRLKPSFSVFQDQKPDRFP